MKSLNLVSIILIFLTPFQLSAGEYEGSVVNIFAKISPRFIMMSSLKTRVEESIPICIVHNPLDQSTVELYIEKVNESYPKGLASKEIKFVATDYQNLDKCSNSLMIFMLDSSEKDIDNSVAFAKKNRILLMSYNPKFLESGVGISIFIGRKVVPFINVKAVEDANIRLSNLLLRISKIYK